MPPPSEGATPAKGILRLVNLSLGIAGVIALPGGFKWLEKYLQANWLLPSALRDLPPVTLAFTDLAVLLGLPASLLLLLFAAMKMHRRLDAPRTRRHELGLACVWITFVGWVFAAHLVLAGKYREAGDAAWAMGLYVSLVVGPVFIAAIIWGLTSAVKEVRALLRTEPLQVRPAAGLLLTAFGLPLALALPLLTHPTQPLSRAAAETRDYEVLCRDAGVRLLAKPSGPVRSIAYDWDPRRLEHGRPSFDRIELNGRGQIRAWGGFAFPRSVEYSKKLDFEFAESRRGSGRFGPALTRPESEFYRFPQQGSYYGVDALTADVLLYTDADRPAELRKALRNQGAVRYELTLTDRRSGAVLGTHTYVVDSVNGRACGANVDGNISRDAFLYDAITR
jgi:hypothetical protein